MPKLFRRVLLYPLNRHSILFVEIPSNLSIEHSLDDAIQPKQTINTEHTDFFFLAQILLFEFLSSFASAWQKEKY